MRILKIVILVNFFTWFFLIRADSMVDQKINYVERGEGQRTVILLHGLGGDWTRWKAVLEPLAKNFRVIALDQLGFGKSSRPTISYSERVLAESLAHFMRDNKISQATIIGNSMGAGVAYGFAVDHPEMVERLIIVNGGPTRCGDLRKKDDPFITKQTKVIDREGVNRYFADLVYEKKVITPSVLDDLYRTRMESKETTYSMVQSFVTGEGCLTNEQIAKIRIPTLFIWGKHDQLSSLERGKRLQSEISGAQFSLIENAAHLPHMEQPQVFVDAVTTFMNTKVN